MIRLGAAVSRVSLLSSVASYARLLGDDELRLLGLIARRLAAGKKVYGELNLMTDQRDFAHECLEESADALVYVACEMIRRSAT